MQDNVAVISVNNIEVGAMPLKQYEAIVKAVKEDWRTRAVSVYCYAAFVMRLVMRLWSYFVMSLAGIFTLIMLYSLHHSPVVAQVVSDFRSLSPEGIAAGLRSITILCVTVTVIAFSLSFLLKGAPVFVSAAERGINNKIREVMEVPAEGKVSVMFKKDGVYCVR